MDQRGEHVNPQHVAAGFQASVVDVLTTKTVRAAKEFNVKQVIAAGGVAANKELRTSLEAKFMELRYSFLCSAYITLHG